MRFESKLGLLYERFHGSRVVARVAVSTVKRPALMGAASASPAFLWRMPEVEEVSVPPPSRPRERLQSESPAFILLAPAGEAWIRRGLEQRVPMGDHDAPAPD